MIDIATKKPLQVETGSSGSLVWVSLPQLDALKSESERNLIDQIRRNLARPVDQRTNFLRKRIGLRGSAL